MELEASLFETEKLLGDEGLRQARIAFEDDRNGFGQVAQPIGVAGSSDQNPPSMTESIRP